MPFLTGIAVYILDNSLLCTTENSYFSFETLCQKIYFSHTCSFLNKTFNVHIFSDWVHYLNLYYLGTLCIFHYCVYKKFIENNFKQWLIRPVGRYQILSGHTANRAQDIGWACAPLVHILMYICKGGQRCFSPSIWITDSVKRVCFNTPLKKQPKCAVLKRFYLGDLQIV